MSPFTLNTKPARSIARLLILIGTRGALVLASIASRLPSRGGGQRPVILPTDPVEGDPRRAQALFEGNLIVGTRRVPVASGAPFTRKDLDPAVIDALHDFGWLRDCRAADRPLVRAHAAALFEEWLAAGGRRPLRSAEPGLAARRLLAFLAHGPVIASESPRAASRFHRALMRETIALALLRRTVATPWSRAMASAAVTASALARRQDRAADRCLRRLEADLDRAILPDGGPVTRDPADLVDLLVALRTVVSAIHGTDRPVSPALADAIQRALAMLAGLRHGDGSLAHFNGGRPPPARVWAALAPWIERSGGRAPSNARASGYQRVEAAGVWLVMDTGAPPPVRMSRHACAGALSIEFGTPGGPLVVNCGPLGTARAAWEPLGRTTAAHSTLVIADTASARLVSPDGSDDPLGAVLLAGPGTIDVRRRGDETRVTIQAAHDGYRHAFGLVHERAIVLARDGSAIAGRDQLRRAAGATPAGRELAFQVRFHLHPRLKISLSPSGRAAVLITPEGAVWRFASSARVPIALEESLYVTAGRGVRKTAQIVVDGVFPADEVVRWRFERLPAGRGDPRS